jgi:hypothetical protein
VEEKLLPEVSLTKKEKAKERHEKWVKSKKSDFL